MDEISFKPSSEVLTKIVPTRALAEDDKSVTGSVRVQQVLDGDLKKCSSKDIYLYYAKLFNLHYPGIVEVHNRARLYKMINNRIQQLNGDVQRLLKIFTFYVEDYHKYFQNPEYMFPRISQLEVNWVFTKLVETYDKGVTATVKLEEVLPKPVDKNNSNEFKMF